MIWRTLLSELILRTPIGRVIEAAQDFSEPVRHPLTYDLVVHRTQLVSDFGFDLGLELGHGD